MEWEGKGRERGSDGGDGGDGQRWALSHSAESLWLCIAPHQSE